MYTPSQSPARVRRSARRRMIQEVACSVNVNDVDEKVRIASAFIVNTWDVTTKEGVREALDALEVASRIVECDAMKRDPASYAANRLTEHIFLVAKMVIAVIFVTKLTALLLYDIQVYDFRGVTSAVFTKVEKIVTVLICLYLIVRFDTTSFFIHSKTVRAKTLVLAGLLGIGVLFAYLFLRLRARHARVLGAALVISALLWIFAGIQLKKRTNAQRTKALPRTGLLDCVFVSIVSWMYAVDNARAFYKP